MSQSGACAGPRSRRPAAAPAPPGSRRAPTRAAVAGRAPRRVSAASTCDLPEVRLMAASPHVTHEVSNQVPPLDGHDVAADQALLAALYRGGGGGAEDELHEPGRLGGTAGIQDQARLANVHKPVLRTHDARGNRIDEV